MSPPSSAPCRWLTLYKSPFLVVMQHFQAGNPVGTLQWLFLPQTALTGVDICWVPGIITLKSPSLSSDYKKKKKAYGIFSELQLTAPITVERFNPSDTLYFILYLYQILFI